MKRILMNEWDFILAIIIQSFVYYTIGGFTIIQNYPLLSILSFALLYSFIRLFRIFIIEKDRE